MSVDLEPTELGFRRPFSHEVSQVLRLHNPNSDTVAFKVKTTAPKQYCVRPNSGRIEPGSNVEVQVLLQAMKEDPPPDARCRDKFLVQSVAVRADIADAAGSNVTQIWSTVEQTAKNSIQEKKIRVTFLPAEDGSSSTSAGGATAIGGATTNGVSHDHTPSSPQNTRGSPTPSAATPQRFSSAAPEKSPGDTTASKMAEGLGLGTAAAAVSSSLPSQDDLKQQLAAANATIARLRQQAEEGLRQRKPQQAAGNAVESVKQSMQNQPAPGGVPVQIVAGLCLLCFLIAYLFF